MKAELARRRSTKDPSLPDIRGMKKREIVPYASQLKGLYQTLIQPISSHLAADSDIVFIPDRELFSIPFSCLVDEKDKFLISKYKFSIAPSIQVFSTIRKQANPKKLVEALLNPSPSSLFIAGNPLMPLYKSKKLADLPGAQTEVEGITKVLTHQNPSFKALLREEATKSSFLQHAPNCQILHLATHGLYDYPPYGALAFSSTHSNDADSFLTYDELITVDLRSVELAVLSACDTAVGEIKSEGILGITSYGIDSYQSIRIISWILRSWCFLFDCYSLDH
jgi:CHAT domain-containing protein